MQLIGLHLTRVQFNRVSAIRRGAVVRDGLATWRDVGGCRQRRRFARRRGFRSHRASKSCFVPIWPAETVRRVFPEHYPNLIGFVKRRTCKKNARQFRRRRGAGAWGIYRTLGRLFVGGLCEEAKKTAATPVLAPPPVFCGHGRGVSRILFPFDERKGATISLGFGLLRTSSDLPAGERNGAFRPPKADTRIFGLAAGGVCRAVDVTIDAVRSYRTISPLPNPDESGL